MVHPGLKAIFETLDIPLSVSAEGLRCESPGDGSLLCHLPLDGLEESEAAVERALRCFGDFREHPAPKRGELVRRMGDRLREAKESLSQLLCLEMGKGIEESRGEVQEMIDICDYATGLSRSLGGRTLFSERPGHRMFEQWHPLGPVLCISAFNFPVAVWSWNAAIALICGDPVIWKPSLKAPLCALATHHLLQPILAEAGFGDAMQLVIGLDQPIAESLVADPRIPLVSATGSCAMGRKVAPIVAARMARSLLELGGNNAIIVDRSANLELAARAILFGAAGTAGQRCTTTRRLFVEAPALDALLPKLVTAYRQVTTHIGDPSDPSSLVGPLIDQAAVEDFERSVAAAQAAGGKILAGGKALDRPGYYVEPTLIRVPDGQVFAPMQEETFAPILYLQSYPEGKTRGGHRRPKWGRAGSIQRDLQRLGATDRAIPRGLG